MRNAIISFPGIGLTVNPPASFDLFGYTIYLYGLTAALGFILGLWYCTKNCKRYGLTEDNVYDTILWALPMGIVGARIYYVLFNFDLYRGKSLLEMAAFWEGGIAIYGGIIGGAITLAIVCKLKKLPVGALLDMGAFGVLLGQGIARWGNFFNREAFGAETEVFTRMGLTLNGTTTYVHPTFLYEFTWNMIGMVLLHRISKTNRRFDGQLFLMYVAWYGFGRFFIEGLRADSLYIGHTGIRVSQVVAAVSFLTAVGLLVYLWNKPHTKYVDRAVSAEENSEISMEG